MSRSASPVTVGLPWVRWFVQDETRLLHGCLKPWNELSIPVKSYDYNIVDVSLDII